MNVARFTKATIWLSEVISMNTEIDLTACEVMVLRDVGCLCKCLLASDLLVLALTNFQLSFGIEQHSDELLFQISCSDKLAKPISCKGHASVHSADSMAKVTFCEACGC